jgi:glycosyltransferase involved in cell wall biosynthesis
MKVCLVVIAKNESHVIGRAIESAKNFVDYVCVVDTGSSPDEFKRMGDIIAQAGVSYSFIEHKWYDFATNRTDALEAAEHLFPEADFLFMMDADDYIEQMTFVEAGLDKNFAGYNVLVKSEDIAYPRTQIFRANGSWRYRGVVHEFPELLQSAKQRQVGTYPITVRSTREGDRNRDTRKYYKDARLLEDALRADTIELDLVPRYTFYLAQSYDGAGEAAKASEMYMKRADMREGYTEERYVSLLRNMRLMEIYDYDPDEVFRIAHVAQAICPQRREVVALAMHLLNDASCHRMSYDLWGDYPTDGTVPTGLFIEPDVYTHLIFDRAAVAAHYCGAYKTALRLNTLALKGHPNMPLDMKRIADNMRWSIDEL